MLGILNYLVYIAVGIYFCFIVFNKYKPYEQLSISLAIGTILSVWLPTIVSLITGKFNIFSNIIALVLVLLFAVAIYFINKKYKKVDIINLYKTWNIKKGLKIATVILPFLVIIYILFYGHVLLEANGNLYGGQSTYGDLSMHMGMITSLAKQGMFPPDYSILPGSRLCYPFLVNLQSASMYLLGTSLRVSIIFPSMVLSLSSILGLYALARTFCKKHSSAVLAVCMFFITGGLGFLYYLDSDGMFLSLFTQYYMTPTNYPPLNLRWVNVICDMMIPQRTFLMGLATVLPIILLIRKSLSSKNNVHLLIAGAMASALPMMHTHSFLALGILCAGLLIGGYSVYECSLGDWIKKWLIFLVPVVLFATPQLIFWVFTQTNSDSFLRIHLDWVNEGNTWLWFWIKNIGLPFLLIIPAFIYSNKDKRLWYISATVIFILAEIIAFQPNEYDNNKLMLIWYVFTCIIVADYMVMLYSKLLKVKGRTYLAILAAIVLFTSGTLTIGRELYSNKQYLQYTKNQVECAQAVDSSVATDVLFVTGPQHLNEIAAIAGRNIYAGSTIYVHFHGLDYAGRYAQIKQIYQDAQQGKTILDEIGADYIYISSYERSDFIIDDGLYSLYPIVYSKNGIEILAVSSEAIDNGAIALNK